MPHTLRNAALLALAAAVLAGPAPVARAHADMVIAVLDFNEAKLKAVASEAQISLVDMLTTSISNGTGIKVIDKESVARVKVKDTAWQQSGFADPATAMNFAKELKVSYVVVGSVSEASQSERESMGITRIKLTVGVEVKAMDSKTGQIVVSATGTGEATTTSIQDEEGVNVAAAKDLGGLYVKAARKAVEQAGKDLAGKLQKLG